VELRQAIADHLGTTQVTRVIYGSIIGLALVVALEHHPPGAGTVAALLVGTGISVGLAELYSEFVGAQVRRRRRAEHREWHHMLDDAFAVTFGVAFPAVFFVLAGLDAMKEQTAFTIAKWTGLGLIAFYGFCAGKLAGESTFRAVVQSLLVALVAGALIALKAVLH
jgi:VIT1/CCC1 family predicted Fe2+/Mn2+ transporter